MSGSSRLSRMRVRSTRFARVIAPITVGLIGLALWQIICLTQTVPASLLPSPAQVGQRLIYDLAHTEILSRTWTTVLEAMIGCVIATVIAIPLGYVMSRWSVAEAAFSPYIAASQVIPAIAIAPLLVIWVGYGLRPIVILCSIIVFFPVVLSSRLGFSSVDKELTEACQLDGATRLQILLHLQGPLALSAILTGLRNGFTLSITAAVFGEFVMGGKGLGLVISTQTNNIDTAGLFSTITVLCVLAIVVYLGLVLIETVTNPMQKASPRVENLWKSLVTEERRELSDATILSYPHHDHVGSTSASTATDNLRSTA